ncbi:MAG: c-type cytochrome biosis protein CcmI [Pseudomonadota bacterium]
MDNWQFWLAATAMTLAVAALLLRSLLRAARDAQAPDRAHPDLALYRDQLAAIDADLARGTLDPDEASRLRAEVSRRLLDADRAARAEAAPAPRDARPLAAMALLLIPLLGAFWAYDRLGAPGDPDLPLATRLALSDELRAARPSQAPAEAEAPPPPETPLDPQTADLIAKLRAAVADRPDDLQGLEFLATYEARLGNYVAARKAMEGVLRVKGDAATAEDFAALGEVMVLAANGLVTPEADKVLAQALTIDPANPTARYYYGLMGAQVGRFDMTFAFWRPLLEDGPQDAPWIAPIRAQIEDIALRAGESYTLPPLEGPDAADMAAAAEMTPEERQSMINAMVQQLSDRLASEGGPVEDWAKLIRALGTLGRSDEAQAIYAEALSKFDGSPSQQSFLKEAAVEAGLTP